ncbi:SpaA isopeptide-forming pilin-related protein [Salibacterium lacus]|uniref:SpaA isopeptide-forming pilin-related protein n=1 Tax=Salibacterium lacus TaxID=1898109 RepID=A0ABW5T4L8_9BACI
MRKVFSILVLFVMVFSQFGQSALFVQPADAEKKYFSVSMTENINENRASIDVSTQTEMKSMVADLPEHASFDKQASKAEQGELHYDKENHQVTVTGIDKPSTLQADLVMTDFSEKNENISLRGEMDGSMTESETYSITVSDELVGQAETNSTEKKQKADETQATNDNGTTSDVEDTNNETQNDDQITPFAGNLNVDVDISPHTDTTISGEAAAYELAVKVTGSKAEYTNAGITIDLPIKDYTSFTQDTSELAIAGVSPVYEESTDQLIYQFDSIETGQTYETMLEVDTENGTSPNNAELEASASFSADQQSSITDNAVVNITTSSAVDVSKSFLEVENNDLNIPSPGARTLWEIQVDLPKNEDGQMYMKEGSQVVLEDTIPDGLSFDGMETGPAPQQNGKTLTWNFDAPTLNEQQNADTELFSEAVRVWLTVDDGTTGTTQQNNVSASATFIDDSTQTSNGSDQVQISSSEAADGELEGNYYVPAHIGPVDGSGDQGSFNNKNPNPTVYDDALLGFRHGIAPLSESQEGDFDGYNTLYRVDENLTFDELITPDNFKYRPSADYPNNIPLDEEPVFNILVRTESASSASTVVTDAEKGEVYTREELGLDPGDKVDRIRYQFTNAPSGMLNGSMAKYYFNVEPGYTGEVENTFNVYGTDGAGNSFNYTYHQEDVDHIAGPRTANIAPEPTDQPPTGYVGVELLDRDNGEVVHGENRMRINLNTIDTSTLAMEAPLETVTLLPPGITVNDSPNASYTNTDGRTSADNGSYEVLSDNYNGSGRQLVNVSWNDDFARPGTGTSAELDVTIAESAPTSLPFDVYGFSGDQALQAPESSGTAVTDTTLQTDTDDLNGDGVSEEPRLKSGNHYIIQGQYDVQTKKLVKGELDDSFGAFGETVPDGSIDYRLNLTNTSGTDISYMTFMDVMPSVGDLGITDNVDRGSQFTPELTGPITMPAPWQDKVNVFYSTAETPERDDLTRNTDYPETTETLSNPTVAEAPNWMTAGEVGDWNSIHTFKIELADDTQWIAGEDITVEFSMQAPSESEVSEDVLDPSIDPTSRAAWNSFALATDEGQPVEPSRVGVYMNYDNTVELTKTDENGDPLADAEFALQDADGNNLQTELTTGDDGIITVENLQPGDYQFVETAPPEGYTFDKTPVEFTVNTDQTETLQLSKENSLDLGSVELTKVNGEGETLEGAVFELQDSNGTTLQTDLTTGSDGTLTVNDLAPGSFQFVETEAPDDYELNEEPLSFDIVPNQEETLEVTKENSLIPGTLELTKIGINGEVLEGVVFELQDDSGSVLQEGLTTDENGKLVLDDLTPGSYQLVETETIEGYQLDDTPVPFEIGTGQTDTNEIEVSNPPLPGSVELTKTDQEGETLEGAVFELQDSSGETLQTELTTGTDGTLTVNDLAPGTYQFIETEAPEDYQLNEEPVPFEITFNQQEPVEVTKENSLIPGTLELTKTGVDGEVLEGVVFELQYQSGAVIDEGLTTDENGQLILDDLQPGSYQLVETQSVEGYQLDDTPVEFEIGTGQNDANEMEVSNPPLPGSVELTKVDEEGEPLPGAEFDLQNAEGEIIEEGLTSNENGIVMVDNLAPGTYEFVETAAPDGYQLAEDPVSFDITFNQQETLEITQDNSLIPGTLELTKTGMDGEVLEGVVFELQDDSGSVLQEGLTTDENGKLVLDDLTPDSYQLVETETIEGYQLDDTPVPFEIGTGQTDTNEIEVSNPPLPGSVELTKTDEESETLEGAVFELQDSSGETLQTELTTGTDGTLTVDDLSPGTYQFIETKAPEGYQLNKEPVPFEITFNQQEPVEVTKENSLIPGTLELTKTGADGEVLEGVVFELQYQSGAVIDEGLTTDENGQLILDDLQPGSYQLVETETVEGYQLDDTPITFEIGTGESERTQVEAVNELTPGSVELTKVDEDNSDNTLEGAEFELQNEEGDVIEETLTTDSSGKLMVEGLTPGSYQFVETKAPDGYERNDDPVPFEIERNQQEAARVTVENDDPPNDTPSPEDDGSVTLTKMSSEGTDEALEGAVFDLEEADGDVVEEDLTTDGNGEITVTDLDPGNYQFVETEAPDGYQLDPAPAAVEIDEDERTTITVENEEIQGSVLLTKVNEEGNRYLEDAVFDLEADDGEMVEENLTTDRNGEIEITDLAPGDYRFVETEAPDGYQLQEKPIEFTVEEDQQETVTVTAENEVKPGAVQLTKKAAGNTDEVLEGAEFTLEESDGTVVQEGLTTGTNGTITVTGLEPGSYQFVETEAPDGYEQTDSPAAFDIEADETSLVTVTKENEEITSPGEPTEPEGSAALTKVDGTDPDQLLEGAEFTLQTQDGTVLEEGLTTNDSGKIFVNNLEPGHYEFVETVAPEGYNPDKEPLSFQIQENQAETVDLTFENEPATETDNPPVEEESAVILTKVDEENHDRLLEGAEFELQDASGNTINSGLTTDESGEIRINELSPGNYQFVETQAPDGYTVGNESASFRIEEGQTQTVELTVENEQENERLPDTSTAIFNYGLAGFLLLTAGFFARWRSRKKE